VEVKRQERTVESYQREAQAWKEEAQRCQAAKAHLPAAQGKPEGLRGVLSEGYLQNGGIGYAKLSFPKRVTVRKGGALDLRKLKSYRSPSTVAVVLELTLPAGAPPWVADGATLEDAQGRALPVLPLWQEAPKEGTEYWLVIVEAEANKEKAQGPFTLKLWEENGGHMLVLKGVTFPPLPE
jgi:uncharacterized protein (TIGR02268 family)